MRGYKPYRATRRGIQNKLFFVQRVVGMEFYMLAKAQLHRVGKVTLLLDPQGNVGLG